MWRERERATYGAEMESIFLLRIGSDILASSDVVMQGGKLLREGKCCWSLCRIVRQDSEGSRYAPLWLVAASAKRWQ